MRKFKFRLETVLHYRETLETLREQEFAEAQGRLAAIEGRIAELGAEFARTVCARPGAAPGEHFDAPAIYDRERYLETLQVAIDQQERRAEAARLIVAEKRSALIAARQAREAVSRLREKDYAAHTALVNKLEQEALDELATTRFAHAAREAAMQAKAMSDDPQSPFQQRKAA